MELNIIPKNIKIYAIILLLLAVGVFLGISAFNISNIAFQTKCLGYFWNLSLYSCFIVTIVSNSLSKTKKKVLSLILLLTLIVSMFIIPVNNIKILDVTLVMLLYNIIFISVLYILSKLNRTWVFILIVNIIILLGLFTGFSIINNFLMISYSTSLTYLLSGFLIAYILFTMKYEIFKINNLYILFIVLGNIITIILYFIVILLYINGLFLLSPGILIFLSVLQPLFYWLGINFILLED